MANGCAIVTTDHGGIRDIVKQEYGVFVEKENPLELSNAISRINNVEKIFMNAFKRACSRFRKTDFVIRVEEILSKIKSA